MGRYAEDEVGDTYHKQVPGMFIATMDLAHGRDVSDHAYSCIIYVSDHAYSYLIYMMIPITATTVLHSLWCKKNENSRPQTPKAGYATTVQDSCVIVRPWKAGLFNSFLRVFSYLHSLAVQRYVRVGFEELHLRLMF